MGEGEGGGGKVMNFKLLKSFPPPLHPLPPVEGRFAGCLYPVRNNAPLVCSGVRF